MKSSDPGTLLDPKPEVVQPLRLKPQARDLRSKPPPETMATDAPAMKQKHEVHR